MGLGLTSISLTVLKRFHVVFSVPLTSRPPLHRRSSLSSCNPPPPPGTGFLSRGRGRSRGCDQEEYLVSCFFIAGRPLLTRALLLLAGRQC